MKLRLKTVIVSFALLGLIATFGATVRLINLSAFPLFADEAIYIRWAQVMRVEPTLRFLPLSDGKQPLYMWVVIPALKFFSDPVLAGRLVSVGAGLGTLLGVALLGYILFGSRRLALLGAVIAAIVPYTVFFDRLALADSLLSMFLLWGTCFLALAFKKQRFDLAMVAGFCYGFAWLTKSPAQIILLLSPALLLIHRLPWSRRLLIHSALLWLSTAVIAFGMYNILRLGPEFHMIALRNLDYVFPLSELIHHPLDPLIPHLKDSFSFYWTYITPFGVLLAIWGLADLRKQHLGPRLILATLILVPVVFQSFIAKAYTARYLLYTTPYIVLLIAHALDHLGNRTQKHLLTYAAAGVLACLCLFETRQLLFEPTAFPMPRIERSGYLEEWTAGTGIPEVASYVRAQALSGRAVVVGSEGFFGTPFDGLQIYLNDLRNVRVVGVGVWIDDVNEKLISALKDNQVFLVVNASRLHADPQQFKHPVKLIASYPKATRPDGTRDSLLFFEVLRTK